MWVVGILGDEYWNSMSAFCLLSFQIVGNTSAAKDGRADYGGDNGACKAWNHEPKAPTNLDGLYLIIDVENKEPAN